MTVIVLFMAAMAAIAAWWLSQQRLTAKPWLEEGAAGDFQGGGAVALPPAKIGLGVFLAVAGSLFAIFVSAYSMRMELVDWRSMPVPRLLWYNTGVLILSSGALQWAQTAARRGEADNVLTGLLAGSMSALVLTTNPANAFFYLITATHGLHVLGGLVALGRTTAKAWRGVDIPQLRLGVELCTMYWHFLLLVWLILLVLLMGWANDFVAICRQLIT
jgi:cytochrome c oxidase subunit 3